MKVLLHACCGPCMTAFDKYFREKGIEYGVFFYNPNIHPYKEYIKRFETLKMYTDRVGVELIAEHSFRQHLWENEFNGLDAGKRCRKCYETRLGHAAEAALENGFTHFATTLLISPYQNHEMIREIAEKAAEEFGVGLYYKDFREYFREGQNIAREEELYRQKYCGCIYSYNESRFKEKIKWD